MKKPDQLIDDQKERPYSMTKRAVKQRSEASTTHGIYRTRTGLERQDRKRLSRYERDLATLLPWLQPSDGATVRSFCYLLLLRDKITSALAEGGLLNKDGEVTRLTTDL